MYPIFSSFLSRHLIDRAGGHRRKVLALYATKRAADVLGPEEQARLQDERLATLLMHARSHVPRFRAVMGSHCVINAENARDVLASLPVMTRAEIQGSGNEFIAEHGGDTFTDATGGSTGTPMRFCVDRATQVARESSLYWSDHLAGWKYGDRIAMLWGSDKDVQSATQKRRAALRWKLDNRRWYNAFDMGEDRMVQFHEDMVRFRPHLIVAYAGSLDVYARFLAGKKSDCENLETDDCKTTHRPTHVCIPYPLTSLVASAETLTPRARKGIEQIFRKPIYNRYGNREFGAIAAESQLGDSLWVNHHDMLVEIISPDPFKIPGPIVVTYFPNKAMPFIRYDTGDYGLKHRDDPSPRSSVTRLERIVGREADSIRTRDGRLIHGEFFTHLLYDSCGIQQFQFVQETLDRCRLVIQAGSAYDPATEPELIRKIQEEVGAEADVVIERVDAIPVLKSGKRKFVLSHVK